MHGVNKYELALFGTGHLELFTHFGVTCNGQVQRSGGVTNVYMTDSENV